MSVILQKQKQRPKVTLKDVVDAYMDSRDQIRFSAGERPPIPSMVYDRLKIFAPVWAIELKHGRIPRVSNASVDILNHTRCIMGEAYGWSDRYHYLGSEECNICGFFDTHALYLAKSDKMLLLFCDHFEEAHVV